MKRMSVTMKSKKMNARQGGRKITRREFVRGSAAAAAFTIVPSSVLPSSAAPAPSQSINLACIGVGDMGRGDMGEFLGIEGVRVVAVCDIAREVDYGKMGHGIAGRDPAIRRVNDHDAGRAKSGLYRGCKGYEDFREMLDTEGDHIDAVCVATPDHVHAAACLAAIDMGKHVYCEKPLAHSIYETRLVTEAARKAGVITQMGNHGHSGAGIRLAVEWI
jgi:predicted dehydrogenase